MIAVGLESAERSQRVATSTSGTILLLRAVLESLLLLLLIRVVEALFFGPGTFASMSLHPFWMVVLIASVQHGLFGGVLTAGLAALMMDWPARPIGMDITEHYLAVTIVPMQWLLVALCMGLFRQVEIRAGRRLDVENARLSEVNEALAAEVDRLDGIIWEMELTAVTASDHAPAAATVPDGTGAAAEAEIATSETPRIGTSPATRSADRAPTQRGRDGGDV